MPTGAPSRAYPSSSLVALASFVALALAAGVALRQVLARPRATGRAAAATYRAVATGSGDEIVLYVPHLPGSITLDGDTDDLGWTRPPGPARTGAFRLPDGREAHPYSDTRAVWGDGHLYLALYASDEDIESRTAQADGPLWLDDSYRVSFTRPGVEYVIEVSPRGFVTDSIRRDGGAYDYSWSSGVHVSPELDGTLNNPQDMDEEWVIEMAVPFESLGMKGEPGESIGMALRRCDTPKGAERVCRSWGEGEERGRIVLE